MKTAGVLALQGDFEAHRKAVERAGGHAIEVRTLADLERCDGLIIPGGESTTMLKLLDQEGLTEPLKRFSEQKPVYGSCAGAILLAREVTHPAQPSLGLMDITVERNAYGRQVDSRIASIPLPEGADLEAVFIRAPIIRRVGPGSNVLAQYNGDPVWVEQGRTMVTTFHPELTGDVRVHQRFLQNL
ncbi:MAG: pyridoxal 5'-phosphate synthase glutaminase subunit PdxT [Acidobacteriota bacterium]